MVMGRHRHDTGARSEEVFTEGGDQGVKLCRLIVFQKFLQRMNREILSSSETFLEPSIFWSMWVSVLCPIPFLPQLSALPYSPFLPSGHFLPHQSPKPSPLW